MMKVIALVIAVGTAMRRLFSVARVVVPHDHVLVIGGPKEEAIVERCVFTAGERLTVWETTEPGTSPRVFVIDERPEVGELSRAVLARFIPVFDAPPFTKPGSS